ncbi:recombinase family protein [Bacillus salipaludis]|uniref:recombinase family protein n=1 Tax=Bacillus salipaludis TaxID=2547811 RepID=UPI003D1CB37E
MSKIIRAAIYTRVSTKEQANNFSLDAQEDVIREYADRKGIEISDVYTDDGWSGKNFDRPEFKRLLVDLREDKFDVILIWKVDRLSRNNTDVLVLLDKELHPANKKLIITSIDMDSSTNEGKMFISLLGTFAAYERATIIDRVSNGMQKRALEGFWNGGKVLGYDSVEDSEDKRTVLAINNTERKLVEEIYLLREKGLGYKAIVNLLNGRGEKTKNGNEFSIPAVKLILENPIYIGKLKWGAHRDWNTKRRKGKSEPTYVDGKHKAIIKKDLWESVQRINQAHKEFFSNNRNFNGDLFLTGILKCPKCGAGTVICKTKKRSGEGYHIYYMCQAYHSKGKSVCSTNLIKKDIVEQKVLNVISEMVRDEEIVSSIIAKLDIDKMADIQPLQKELKTYQVKLNTLLSGQAKLDKDYFADKIETSLYNRLSIKKQSEIDSLHKLIHEQQNKIEKLSRNNSIDKEIVIAALLNFNELFHKADSEEKRMLVRALIKEIQMEDNRKDIKNITFWFSSEGVLPSNKASRTGP